MSISSYHVTAPAEHGAEIEIPANDDAKMEIGLAILAVADMARVSRESHGAADPLAPVIVRVWPVTSGGTYILRDMLEHTVIPQPADS